MGAAPSSQNVRSAGPKTSLKAIPTHVLHMLFKRRLQLGPGTLPMSGGSASRALHPPDIRFSKSRSLLTDRRGAICLILNLDCLNQ
jgi:hypothetical protein